MIIPAALVPQGIVMFDSDSIPSCHGVGHFFQVNRKAGTCSSGHKTGDMRRELCSGKRTYVASPPGHLPAVARYEGIATDQPPVFYVHFSGHGYRDWFCNPDLVNGP